MLTPEILAKLTPEQKEVAEKWEKEREDMDVLINALQAADVAGDIKEYDRVFKQILDTREYVCEHGRSIWSTCTACHELEMILYPDLFDEDGNRLDP